MAGVKHTFSVNIADDASAIAAGMVLPSHWNAEHTLSGVAEQSALDVTSAAVAALSAAHTSLADRVSANSATGGSGSVTSAEHVSVVDRVSANSAQMRSADNAISAAAAAVSAALNLTNAALSLTNSVNSTQTSAIAANSAQMTSADDAISNAVSIVSAAQAVTSAAVTSVNSVLSSRTSAIQANSAQMTSADAALSLRITSVDSVVSVHTSAIAANSVQMRSADNAISSKAADAFSIANAVSNRLSGWKVSNLADVSIPTISTGQTLVWDSAQQKFVASLFERVSVTSAELSAVSAAAAAAVAVVSVRVNSVNEFGAGQQRVLDGAQLVTGTALVSISGFSFSIGINNTYGFEFLVMVSSPISLAVPQFMLSTPAPTFLQAKGDNPQIAEATRITHLVSQGNRWTGMTTVSAVGVPRQMVLKGAFKASAAGTMALNVGNAISGAGAGSAITIMAGSYGMVWRMV